jgi:hypothetical protein
LERLLLFESLVELLDLAVELAVLHHADQHQGHHDHAERDQVELGVITERVVRKPLVPELVLHDSSFSSELFSITMGVIVATKNKGKVLV